MGDTIRVCCRFRPINKREREEEEGDEKFKNVNVFQFASEGKVGIDFDLSWKECYFFHPLFSLPHIRKSESLISF